MKEKETYQDTVLKPDTIITNQTVLPNNKTVHLTATVEDSQPQALRLGTNYEKLLQDEKSVATNSTVVPIEHQVVHDDGHRSSSYDTTASSASKEVIYHH